MVVAVIGVGAVSCGCGHYRGWDAVSCGCGHYRG